MTEVFTGKVLAQSRPGNTSAASIYTLGQNQVTLITRIVVVNTTTGNETFEIFLDDDGTTYDESTALFFDETLNSKTEREIEADWWMATPGGNLAVQVSTASAITFTVFGIEYERT